MYFVLMHSLLGPVITKKKPNVKLTYHVNHVLKVFLTDKMVINSILLSIVGPPCGVTGSVEKHTRTNTKERKTQSAVSSNHPAI